jgi:hypothetical protein
MPNDYDYSVAQCDVAADKRGALQSYRDKLRLWRSWIETDEHQAIWRQLSSMVWTDVSFNTLRQLAINDKNSALHNQLLMEALTEGHVARQILAIRRLMDTGTSDIISLRRLVKDIRRNFHLFTRENYVCFDGLPYDYEAVLGKEMVEHAIWGSSAHDISRMLHEQFDRLAGIDPAKRSREDRLPPSLLATIERWLDESGADGLAKWSHAYLAHAGGPEARKRIDDLLVSGNKITHAIKPLARVTEAVSASLLHVGSGSISLMPIDLEQFNPFERLDQPIIRAGGEGDAYKLWHRLSKEANRYLDGVEDELISKPGRRHRPRRPLC